MIGFPVSLYNLVGCNEIPTSRVKHVLTSQEMNAYKNKYVRLEARCFN